MSDPLDVLLPDGGRDPGRFGWGTVVSLDPLQVVMDRETNAVDVAWRTAIVHVGDRVRTHRDGQLLGIVGVAGGGANPVRVTDWNDATQTGIYVSIGAADNRPEGVGNWVGTVTTYGTAIHQQLRRNITSGSDYGIIYYRYFTGTAWQPWSASITRQTPGIPYAMASGRGTITGNGTLENSVDVTLPSGRFTVTPTITVTSTNRVLVAALASASSTTFTAYLRHISASTWTSTNSFHWVAVQMTPTSAEG